MSVPPCWTCGAGGYRIGHAEWCEAVARAVNAANRDRRNRTRVANPRGRSCRRCGRDDWYVRPYDGYAVCWPCIQARRRRGYENSM